MGKHESTVDLLYPLLYPSSPHPNWNVNQWRTIVSWTPQQIDQLNWSSSVRLTPTVNYIAPPSVSGSFRPQTSCIPIGRLLVNDYFSLVPGLSFSSSTVDIHCCWFRTRTRLLYSAALAFIGKLDVDIAWRVIRIIQGTRQWLSIKLGLLPAHCTHPFDYKLRRL